MIAKGRRFVGGTEGGYRLVAADDHYDDDDDDGRQHHRDLDGHRSAAVGGEGEEEEEEGEEVDDEEDDDDDDENEGEEYDVDDDDDDEAKYERDGGRRPHRRRTERKPVHDVRNRDNDRARSTASGEYLKTPPPTAKTKSKSKTRNNAAAHLARTARSRTKTLLEKLTSLRHDHHRGTPRSSGHRHHHDPPPFSRAMPRPPPPPSQSSTLFQLSSRSAAAASPPGPPPIATSNPPVAGRTMAAASVKTGFVVVAGMLVTALALGLALVQPSHVELYPAHPLGAFQCVVNVCRFPYTDYPRAVACRDRSDCVRYFDPCASNPCEAAGTAYCETTSKGDHQCICKAGYGGRHCHLHLHPCDHDDPCVGARSSCRRETASGGDRRRTDEEAEEGARDRRLRRYRCDCEFGRYGKDCRYRSRAGDTCTADSHCEGEGGDDEIEDDGRRLHGASGVCMSAEENGGRRGCRCPIRRHGVHCEKTFQVEDCLVFLRTAAAAAAAAMDNSSAETRTTSPCGGRENACIERDVGFHCHCGGHLAGRRCQFELDRTACRHVGGCKNGGRCVDDDQDDQDDSERTAAITGKSCVCPSGYGGIDCGLLDVSMDRARKTWTTGRCNDDDDDVDDDVVERKRRPRLRHGRRPYNGTRPSVKLHGRWYLARTTDNAFNPRDACPQIYVGERRARLRGVAVDFDTEPGWLVVEYAATRNDTSSHFEVKQMRIRETTTTIRAVWRGNATAKRSPGAERRKKGGGGGGEDEEEQEEEEEEEEEEEGGTGDHHRRLPFLVQMRGSVVRDYTYPVKPLESYDRFTVSYRPLLYDGGGNHLILLACVTDDTHGAIESMLLLSRNLEPVGLRRAVDKLEKAFPRLVGRTVEHQDHDACRG